MMEQAAGTRSRAFTLFETALGWPLVPGAMIAGVALCVLPMLLAIPETRPARDSPGTKGHDGASG